MLKWCIWKVSYLNTMPENHLGDYPTSEVMIWVLDSWRLGEIWGEIYIYFFVPVSLLQVLKSSESFS